MRKNRDRSWWFERRAAGTLAVAALFVAAVAFPAAAGVVSGTVTDGTTNKVVAGATVILLQLQGGMESVATTKTDAGGHFSIENPVIGTAPMLLRVPYRGVLYHEPVAPGSQTVKADVEVYEPTSDPHAFAVSTHAIVLQPKGDTLLIGEEYTIENQTNPPVAFYLKSGSFDFHLPKGAQLDQVSASGPTGMPVVQGTIDKGGNVESIDWPFRPGENGVRISYELPYPGNATTLENSSVYNVERVLLVAPPGVQVNSAGFTPAGTEQGYDIYTRDQVAANSPLTISVSGTAPEPSASNSDSGAGSDSQNPSVNSHADSGDAVGATVTLPARLDGIRYILVAGFAILFVLGVVFLWRRPVAEPAPGGASSAAGAMAAVSVPERPRKAAPPAKASSAEMPVVSQAVAQMDREVSLSLDQIKESLFRLELRRQAGTISEEDYAREWQRTEKILRDFVKG